MKTDILVLIAFNLFALCHAGGGYGCLLEALQGPDVPENVKKLLSKYDYAQGGSSVYEAFIKDFYIVMDEDLPCDYDVLMSDLVSSYCYIHEPWKLHVMHEKLSFKFTITKL
ncbi:unnamed protein product [Ranitomeya imitator]|uniref:Uncharacterized protein n=1 Tax=Ranitomeya imitator TaxID=111125 RepID=A0ABN9KUJ1_9NEOB|nr:unnamed protein product [Ranitomeya imitator]